MCGGGCGVLTGGRGRAAFWNLEAPLLADGGLCVLTDIFLVDQTHHPSRRPVLTRTAPALTPDLTPLDAQIETGASQKQGRLWQKEKETQSLPTDLTA